MTVKNYTINKIKQLIDLNGSSVNFEAAFRVSSSPKDEIFIAVVDQDILDGPEPLQYRKIPNGEFSGTVSNSDNNFKHFYIVLKSEFPAQCQIEIQKREIPHNPHQPIQNAPQPVPQNSSPSAQNSVQNAPQPAHPPQPTPSQSVSLANVPPKSNGSWVKYLLIFLVLAVGGYYLYTISKGKSNDSSNGNQAVTPSQVPPVKFEFSPAASSASSSSPANPILSRLKNLSLS